MLGATEYCVDVCSTTSNCDTWATDKAIEAELKSARKYECRQDSVDGQFFLWNQGARHVCVTWRQTEQANNRTTFATTNSDSKLQVAKS